MQLTHLRGIKVSILYLRCIISMTLFFNTTILKSLRSECQERGKQPSQDFSLLGLACKIS